MAASCNESEYVDAYSDDEELERRRHSGLAGLGDDDGDEDDEIMICAPSKCFFCDSVFKLGSEVIDHAVHHHNVPLDAVLAKDGFEFYTFVKMVNYFRKMHPTIEQCQDEGFYRQLDKLGDEFMIPVDPEDGMLQFDFDSFQENLHKRIQVEEDSDKAVTISRHEYQHYKKMATEMLSLKKQLEDLTDQYQNDINQCRYRFQRLFRSRIQGFLNVEDLGNGKSSPPADEYKTSQIHKLSHKDDGGYIGSYSHYSIHMEMLQDDVRTDSYRRAILENRHMFEDKVVLDLGCGTGILSMFAARAGARKVIGVDMSDIIYQAMDIVRENGLQDKITLLKGRIEDLELPVGSVDVIISEWMGYFLLFESMLDSVVYARNKWMSPNGIVWPNHCQMLLTASDDRSLYERNIGFWNDVYGFKMSCMKQEVRREALIQVVNGGSLVCTPTVIKDIDCCNCDVTNLDFTSRFVLTLDRDCDVYALIGYFTVLFDHSSSHNKISFNTSPSHKATHWKQTVFLLSKPLSKGKGDTIQGSIRTQKLPEDPRSLQITIEIDCIKYKYHLS